MLELNLTHRFQEFQINLAFKAKQGSITSLFGRSGTGKTSIINMIAGIVTPDTGMIKVGEDVLFDSAKGINLPPVLGIHTLLDRKPANLSGGEKQRVAIGRALLSQPRLLLMDEPLASIDIQLRSEILPYIEDLRDTFGLTVIYVSHSIDEVIRLSDKMVLISNGIKQAEGNVEEIMSRLDLHSLTGRFNAGAVLSTTVESYDVDYDLTGLAFKGGTLRVTGVNLTKGTSIRAHILARDVSLMLHRPVGTSILNVFEGTIIEVADEGGPQLDLKIDIGTPLIARITRKSFNDLDLAVSKNIFTMIKAVAIDRRSLGRSALD
jgi:molybdate transport system ATP-binding protein